jgi:SecD/SecF fusion protein
MIHDAMITIGLFVLLQKEVNLATVAALLTVVGYSINDTIVIFDRIREVKGKSPKLTPEMINTSVNQTLARTILTSLTVFMSVVMLYVFGGEGIHGFAFALVVGVLAGTYSTVFIACPTVLWLNRRWEAATVKHGAGDLTRLSSAGRR